MQKQHLMVLQQELYLFVEKEELLLYCDDVCIGLYWRYVYLDGNIDMRYY